MTKSEKESNKVIHQLLHPGAGGAIKAARLFGIDLTLLAERLRMSPEERLLALQSTMQAHAKILGSANLRHP